MQLKQLNPRKALNKAFLKVKPNRTDIECFKTNLVQLLDATNDNESEEFHKNLVIDFLKKTWYDPRHFINTKGRNDLVIHTGNTAKTPVGVIIEAKRPSNRAEMITTQKLNAKAFQELVLYYLRERITHNNIEVKHLVATNINEWFIFDASLFERLFAQNKILVKQFIDFEAGRLPDTRTEFFYQQIAEPFIAGITTEVEYTYFNIQDYQKPLRNADKKDDNALIALYKLLSPEHLLKLPFANDSNSLDRRFYGELLHIIGLTETKEGGKKLIERNKPGERHTGTILEDAIIQLDSLDKLSRLDKPGQFGSSTEERLFNVALELSLTWINRILFLKLLEAQLITYHRGDKAYSFLSIEKIKNYDDLNSLFFQVLARKYAERNEDVKKIFERVPYLNSTLFEPTEIEQTTLFISNLKDDKTIPIYGQTVLKDPQGKKRSGKLTTLEYLFAFLDAYDFSSEGSEDIQEDNKTLINASVLGLIFEKINGYKDGSFFTPGFITMYMCRETIRKAVVQKFNETKQWNCNSIAELYDKIDNRQEANDIVNSIKVCDPAVGSGHFLVSALNEMIAVKSDLRILQDRDGRRLKEYQVEVVNDELIVTDEEGELFEYNPLNKETQRIQETLFHEKQTIIERCLFGVDINTNSVKICRLRLWIELLKNAYYKNPTELETLPNIDINIKCGNSLVSRFAMDADLKQALKKSKWTIDSYRLAVDTYRNAESKEQKREMERLIAGIKSDFRSEISLNDPLLKKLQKARGEFLQLSTTQSLFEKSQKEKAEWNKKVQQLSDETQKLESEIESIKANKIFENAFEWRFEFPEVLNEDGDFMGFDVVIGNPPYIRQEELSWMKPFLQKHFQTYAGTADLYVFFVEKGMQLLKGGGQFCYILPNKWMKGGYGRALRQWAGNKQTLQIVDFGDLPVFEEATTYPCIWQMQNNAAKTPGFKAVAVDTLSFTDGLEIYLQSRWLQVDAASLNTESWNLVDSRQQQLLDKIKAAGKPLGEYVNGRIYYGIKTGYNDAFVIDNATRQQLMEADPRSEEIIKPFLAGRDIKRYQQPVSDKWLLFIPWHFPLHKDETISGASDKAEAAFKNEYPAIYAHLYKFKYGLENRNKAETGIRYEWYALQRCAATYFSEFDEPKIMIPAIVQSASYGFDTTGAYSNDKTSIIPTHDYYLLGLLNSRLVDFYLKQFASTKQNGYYEYKPLYVSQLPIVDASDDVVNNVTQLVDKILAQNGFNEITSSWEQQIDMLVYEAYGLTDKEIEIVEGA